MVFSNLVFLFVFLPIVIITYYVVPNFLRNYLLLTASLLFYAWGEPQYIFLMIFSILMNYIFGLVIHRLQNHLKAKKAVLILSVIGNLVLLGYYKYVNFIIDNINNLFHLEIQYESIPLPIGISFFTFQAMSYVIDVYRNDVTVQKEI